MTEAQLLMLKTWDDVKIKQAPVGLDSRSEAITRDGFVLPIYVAPMDMVLDGENYPTFMDEKLKVCLPRGIKSRHQEVFESMSLEEFEQFIRLPSNSPSNKNILIDVANGSMPKLHSAIRKARHTGFDKLYIMAGNVGSVYAFEELAKTGVNAIRCGIGGGSVCNTTFHTGIGQHMPQLIYACHQARKRRDFDIEIVADGGFKSYRDIICALWMGADSVMCGNIFAKCLESCSPKVVSGREYEKLSDENFTIIRQTRTIEAIYRGMSTIEVQTAWGKDKVRHSEGKTVVVEIDYTLNEWLYGSNDRPDEYPGFENVLASAMAYTGSRTLSEFKIN